MILSHFSKISHEDEIICFHRDQIISFHRIFKNWGRKGGGRVQVKPLSSSGSATEQGYQYHKRMIAATIIFPKCVLVHIRIKGEVGAVKLV